MASPYMTVGDVADLLRCESSGTAANERENRLKQARHWLKVNHVPGVRVGKRKLILRSDVAAVLVGLREESLALEADQG